MYRPLVLLFGAGTALRLFAAYGDWPAFFANPDSISYMDAAHRGLFSYPERPAGYPVFLRVVHGATFGWFPAEVALQHALGLAAGLLLYAALRRLGMSRPLALLPSGAILLGGDQLFYEHAILSEALFTFLLVGALYAAVRALDERPAAWAAVAGALLGGAATVRTVGVFLLPAIALWLLFARSGPWRGRLLPAVACVVAGVVPLAGYVGLQAHYTHDVMLSRTSGWSLYARVGHFADCDKFTPPRGTKGLCQDIPASKREGPVVYFHDASSPARLLLGQPPAGDAKLGAFARQAILHQPLDYAKTVGKDMLRYVYPEIGRHVPASGTPPDGLLFSNASGRFQGPALYLIGTYWHPVVPNHRASDVLARYQRMVRVHGFLLPPLFLLAVAGLWPADRRRRAGIALLGGGALLVMAVPAATLLYGWRYAVPVLPALVGAAMLGGSALVDAWRARKPAARTQVPA